MSGMGRKLAESPWPAGPAAHARRPMGGRKLADVDYRFTQDMNQLQSTLPSQPDVAEAQSTEMSRTARRLDGSLLLTPRSEAAAASKYGSTINYNAIQSSPRDHPMYQGAAGISSYSMVNHAKVAKGERWVAMKTTHDDVGALISPR